MSESRYELTAAQAAFLEEARQTPRAGGRSRGRASHVKFPGSLPPVSDQAVRGTCVANAVAALVACYEGCRRRVSVQYLDEVTRLVEQAWVTRNLKRLASGESVERDFEAAFPEAVSQAALLVKANGADSDAALAFVRALGTKIRSRVEADAGCRLKRCFEALEQYGVCREELWPYSPVALNVGAAGGDAVGAFPPGTHEDARRHRIVNDLYVLRAPNNVDEIKGILAGARGRRPMPVSVGLELFKGRTDGVFSLPEVVCEADRVHVAERPLGIHEVLLIGYTDDAKSPGGGYFTFQNSWGRSWGDGGLGRVSYAYVACFCREAGTILQESDDCAPGLSAPARDEVFVIARRRATILCAVGICLFAAAISIFVAVRPFFADAVSPPRQSPPVDATPTPRQSPSVDATPTSRQSPPVEATPPSRHPADRDATRASRPQEDDDDDSFAIVKVVDYRYLMRGTCDSAGDVRKMVNNLRGRHQEFSCEEIRGYEEERYFEGEFVIEGIAGRPPHAIQVVEEYFKRKNLEMDVRKWSVRRLR